MRRRKKEQLKKRLAILFRLALLGGAGVLSAVPMGSVFR
jgi:hypothetical protein